MKKEKDLLHNCRSQIYYLRKDLEVSSTECSRLKAQNNRLRAYVDGKFSWFVDLLAQQQTPSLPWLIKDMKDFLIRERE